MKRVTFEYGCRALGYVKGELFVDEKMPNDEIQKKIEDEIEFFITFNTEDGYEARTETVYRKVR